MKYLLFDLTVLAIFFIAAAWGLIENGGSAIVAQECNAAYGDTNQTSASKQLRHQHYDISKASPEDKSEPGRMTSPDTSNDDAIASYLKVGSMVELYGAESYFAIPATIIGYNKEKHSTKYNLQNFISNTSQSKVDPEFVHPYQVYEDGTRAYCNVGALHEIYMVPCKILSHSINKSGFVSYQVFYSNEEGELFPEYLPFSRVQRDIRRRNL
eukprot:CAMPEP_0172314210 /NCGR_PEP_ID=MMETSP1058-20130122/21950_1 /TAXON_ID=83371 /ORGANISM="Detonula confervacea, Strain CCMP 353" /LENGTH=211 /DNA_ID=CAMNT_0013028019 /DNA_START=164 /DNA_END=799 /DNA_ORIENTATION=+